MGQSLSAFPGPATDCNLNLLLGSDKEIPAQNLMGLPFRSQSWPKMQVITCVGPCSSSQYRQKDLLPIKPQYSSSNVIDNIFAVCFSHLFLSNCLNSNARILGSIRMVFQLKTLHVERQKNKKQNKGCVHIIFKIMFITADRKTTITLIIVGRKENLRGV